MTTKVKHLSTTALSKEMSISTKDLFSQLVQEELIIREDDSWALTEKGEGKGGQVKTHRSGNSYIVWPENLKEEFQKQKENNEKLLTATALSKKFAISKFRINPIISELGWIQKGVKGWVLTPLGKLMGGKQFEHDKSGVPYVCWEEKILNHKRFLETIREAQGEGTEEKAEMLIDNWLYMSEIVHAYERKLPVEEDVYCDFYLPVGKVYIEYWDYEDDEKYLDRKKEKQSIYDKYGFNLIELHDSDIQNLDDILPKKLLKFGIQAY
jgi:hypothetical protein